MTVFVCDRIYTVMNVFDIRVHRIWKDARELFESVLVGESERLGKCLDYAMGQTEAGRQRGDKRPPFRDPLDGRKHDIAILGYELISAIGRAQALATEFLAELKELDRIHFEEVKEHELRQLEGHGHDRGNASERDGAPGGRPRGARRPRVTRTERPEPA